MLKLQDIELRSHYPHGYSRGATPGFRCKVTLQTGDHSYERVEIELPSEAVKTVVTVAIAEAMKRFTIDLAAIDVEGAPGEPEPEPSPPVDTKADPALAEVL